MSEITRETVQHIAALAKLRLEEHEVESLKADLSKIVAYMAELNEVDTSGVAPTAHMTQQSMMRPDERKPGLTPEQALKEAPRSIAGGFAVPGFVEER